MADLGITNSDSFSTGNFYYKNTPLHQVKKTIAASQTLSAGCILGIITSSGELKAWAPYASDGSQTIYGVLMEDIDTTEGSATASVGVLGQFITQGLSAFAGTTTINITDGAHKYGTIIFKSEE